jgi:hypothetical protein
LISTRATDFVTHKDIGRFNKGVMKAANFSRPKHGAVTYVTLEKLKAAANHWNVAIILDSMEPSTPFNRASRVGS